MEDEPSESASVAVRRIEKGSHEFVLNNYSVRKGTGDMNRLFESEQFAVGGHSWTIRLYPGGMTIDAHNAGDASLFIYLKSETSTPVQCLFDLYILDQSGRENHYGRSIFQGLPPFSINHNKVGGYPHFIKRAVLESSDYLKDDCLKIRSSICVLSFHIQELPIIQVPESNKGTDFGKFLESRQGADVFFKVAGESFCAHKCILAAHSPVFMSRLSDDHQPQEIVIPDIEPRTFKALLWFIYTGRILEEEQEAFGDSAPLILKSFWGKMLAAADQFELEGLKMVCESRILERLSGESVAYLLHLADLYHATELKDACFKFLAENQADFMDSDGSKYLKEACPVLYLELAGYNENRVLQLNRGKDLDVCSKILHVVKDYFVGMFLPWDASDMQLDAKEA
ncbi:hypothetical protein BUALT_Bualt07G0004700 [Buddleja alternifolia]|uniref:Speckle-type POZ protein n=1 Tax=Buddleja alternifolia TaxID=168488 RepID=A0AAV6XHN7_9LAMI|nr:hypothetical protein BUALT_Bualt07G0004700 [Buddleja alternifolia]